MERADDAKARLIALKQPVPRPTKAMLAQNKAEEASRREQTTVGTVMSAFSRHPDVTATARVGDPPLQDQDLISAKNLVEQTNRVLVGKSAEHTLQVTAVKGVPAENQKAPTSDNPNPESAANTNAAENPQPDPNDLKPTTQANSQQKDPDPDANDELKPNVPQDSEPAQAPPAVNEIAQSGANGGGATASAGSTHDSGQDLATDEQLASSKHKKKKGILDKIIPGK
jgi:hypothetical protein